jgi:hypothetical protein
MPADRNSLTSSSKKGIFALAAALFAIQIAFDLAHSVTAFPFVHYGMFSESFAAPDSLLSYEVTVDGQRLVPADFNIYHWDMIQQPLGAFDKHSATADFAADKKRMQSILSGPYSLVAANLSNDHTVADRFPDWYRNYLSRLIHRPIHTLQVDHAWYQYQNSHFILLKKLPWIDIR